MARQLAEAGVDLQDVADHRLIMEGVRSFADSFEKLLAGLRRKRDTVLAGGSGAW